MFRWSLTSYPLCRLADSKQRRRPKTGSGIILLSGWPPEVVTEAETAAALGIFAGVTILFFMG
jgi:hypothetical protein